MKNKKGFTLIELLAVIVILAIIALITTPIILNMIEDARKSAAVDSAYGYIEAIEYQNSINQLNSKYDKIESGEVTSLNSKVNVKGTKPTSGTVEVDTSGRVIKAMLCINGYNIDYNGEKAIDSTKCGKGIVETPDESLTKPTIEIPTGNETYKAIIYLDPTNLTKKCTKEEAQNNLNQNGTSTEIKSGCMKWYAYDEDETNYKLLLDHNTTALVAYNSGGKNNEMKEVQDELNKLISEENWKIQPRLITADEIAGITGNKTFDSKVTTMNGYFYFDSNLSSPLNPRTTIYAWLYDNTYSCIDYKCEINDNNIYKYGNEGKTGNISGYWTSSKINDSDSSVWYISRIGYLDRSGAHSTNHGLRPVIIINK